VIRLREPYLKVFSIDSTLSGEGKFTGYPTTLIRLYGCNLLCDYCDAIQPEETNTRKYIMSIGKIVDMINKIGNKYVLITGGEPLLQKATLPLVYELNSLDYQVWIETNGSIPIEKDGYRRKWFYTMDIKTPSSGMAHKNVLSNIKNLLSVDEIKFVISDYSDYMFACSILKQYYTAASVIFSPVFDDKNKHNAKELAEWIIGDRLTNVRLGMQIHKIIGVA
jgi:7-carboxy-7-deazaguanine synthase